MIVIGFGMHAICAANPAAEFIGGPWRNTPHSLHLYDLRGKVVVVHFWTLGCINCKHNLGYYNAWYREFAGPNFEMVGIHTPETDFERSQKNLDEAIQRFQIKYPVLSDNSSANWDRWRQQYWPAVYLIDKHGRVRDTWEGELEFNHGGGSKRIENEIRQLEAEK